MFRPCVAVGCIGFPKELHVMDITREKCGHCGVLGSCARVKTRCRAPWARKKSCYYSFIGGLRQSIPKSAKSLDSNKAWLI
jgi:hypothetical protein